MVDTDKTPDRGRWHRIVVVSCTVLVLLGLSMLTAQARATLRADDAVSGELEVEAEPAAPQFDQWAPDTARYWRIRSRISGAESSYQELRVNGSGDLVTDPDHGLTVRAWTCTQPYPPAPVDVRPVCPDEEEEIVSQDRLADLSSDPGDADTVWAWFLPDATAAWTHLLVELARPGLQAGASDTPVRTARFGVGVYAYSDLIDPPDPQEGEGTPTPTDSPEPTEPTDPTDPVDPTDPEGPAGPGGPDPTVDVPGLPDTGGPGLAVLLVGVGLTGLGLTLRRRR